MKKANVKNNERINANTLEKEYSLGKCTKKSRKGNGGITLIAWVITVIVLLILARHQHLDVKPETIAS